MSVIREQHVKMKSAILGFRKEVLDLENYSSESQALKIYLRHLMAFKETMGDCEEIINERLETLEREDNGKI